MAYGKNVHRLIDLVDRHRAMDLCHGSAGRLHRVQGLLVDIRRFDRVDLLFELGDLRGCLFEVLLVDLFPSQSGFGSCGTINLCSVQEQTKSIRTILICRDVPPSHRILFLHQMLQVLFSLLQHIQLPSEQEDRVLGRLLALLSGGTAEPGPHYDCRRCQPFDKSVVEFERDSLR
jgi:hypothetical protein